MLVNNVRSDFSTRQKQHKLPLKTPQTVTKQSGLTGAELRRLIVRAAGLFNNCPKVSAQDRDAGRRLFGLYAGAAGNKHPNKLPAREQH